MLGDSITYEFAFRDVNMRRQTKFTLTYEKINNGFAKIVSLTVDNRDLDEHRVVTRLLGDLPLPSSVIEILSYVFALYPEFNSLELPAVPSPDPVDEMRKEIENPKTFQPVRADTLREGDTVRILPDYSPGEVQIITPISENYFNLRIKGGNLYKLSSSTMVEVLR